MPIARLRPVLVLVSHCCRHPSFARDRHQQYTICVVATWIKAACHCPAQSTQ
ncbi:uncharacterized protein BDW70DRAFT_134098 [Aspergillus foveolatus]|uniref:uncharacterized protein n=1 Tax=Aspergillus foveolatus TaxID=210207 RepID=UPI003CCCAE25